MAKFTVNLISWLCKRLLMLCIFGASLLCIECEVISDWSDWSVESIDGHSVQKYMHRNVWIKWPNILICMFFFRRQYTG